jgi:hypothetical protein
MNVRWPVLWLRILRALTYVGRILLLRIQWVTVLHDLSLRNTSWKTYLLCMSPNLCTWKFLNSWHHFRNHLHFLNTYRGYCTHTCYLERIPESIPQSMSKWQNTRTFSGYLLRCLSLWEINTLLVYKYMQKTPTLDRNVRKIFMF